MSRRLTGRLPNTQRRHLLHVKSQMRKHKVIQKHHDVCRSVRPGRTSTQERWRLEQLDRVKTDIQLAGEKRCRKLAMGDVDYSPRVAKLLLTRNTWKLIVKKLQGKRVHSSLIKRKAKHCNIARPLHRSLAEATRELRTATKIWEEAKPLAPLFRKEFLWERASRLAPEQGKTAEAVYQRLIQEDHQRKGFQILRKLLHRQSGKAVQSMIIGLEWRWRYGLSCLDVSL